ncbi:DUF1963 domain-containing protein [Umezawaea tangerina]|uniref:Uncharacterized protein DUF1963 n=1 Tax=Umezawaea tangerina TaxID=84725 RepID=A0A2T0SV82_9PSEU|nr:DUF1963 domain-containing protein [Umezawaea tangerina]PRY37319.1 uncharacterized protein DUF1963 [Umezawaea tangerina]
MSALDEFREAARKQDVPEHVVDRAVALARPSLELFVLSGTNGFNGSAGAPGAPVGQYLGNPYLPDDVEWSGYPDFVASVDLSAVPVGELDIPLPEDGHLLFFADRRTPDWEPDVHCWVVYVPAGTPTSERVPTPEHLKYTRGARPLVARLDRHVPDFNNTIALGAEVSGLFDEHLLSVDGCPATANELIIGGYTHPIHEDPCEWPDTRADAEVLLAQSFFPYLDDPGRCGAYWLITHKDLAERNFANARLREQHYL